jgi:hypothetical protein
MSTSPNQAPTVETRPLSEVAGNLKVLLRRYDDIAYVVGVKQARTVRNWAEHGVTPSEPRMRQRLEVAEMLASIVAPRGLPHVPAAWLIFHNPYVDEQPPCELIRSLDGSDTDMETVEKLVFAAESFAGTAA